MSKSEIQFELTSGKYAGEFGGYPPYLDIREEIYIVGYLLKISKSGRR